MFQFAIFYFKPFVFANTDIIRVLSKLIMSVEEMLFPRRDRGEFNFNSKENINIRDIVP